MGRHDIRLRRKRMTSRRIESHKNYYEVMRRHQKTSRLKKVFKLVVLLIFFLALIFFSYSLLTKVSEADQPQKENTSLSIKMKQEQRT